MRRDDTRGVFRVDREQDRERSWRGDDHVVAVNRRASARDEHASHVRGDPSVAFSAKPPTGWPVAQTLKFLGKVVREVRNVV